MEIISAPEQVDSSTAQLAHIKQEAIPATKPEQRQSTEHHIPKVVQDREPVEPISLQMVEATMTAETQSAPAGYSCPAPIREVGKESTTHINMAPPAVLVVPQIRTQG